MSVAGHQETGSCLESERDQVVVVRIIWHHARSLDWIIHE